MGSTRSPGCLPGLSSIALSFWCGPIAPYFQSAFREVDLHYLFLFVLVSAGGSWCANSAGEFAQEK